MSSWLDKLQLTDEEYSTLVQSRGGCSCHSRPPCGACSDPITEEEAEMLGYVPTMGEEAEATLKTYQKYELGMAVARPEGTSTWQERLELSGLYDNDSPHKPKET